MNRLLAAPILLTIAACTPSPPAAEKKEQPVYERVDPTTAGTLRGSVRYAGPRPKRQAIRIDEDATCERLNPKGMIDESIAVRANGALSNVLVYVKSGLGEKKFAPPSTEETVTIDQKSCRFSPRVLGVRVGQTIRVTNSDPLTHNIHPQPKTNRDWNQSQPEGAPALERKFVYPEMHIRVKCNVHSWMRAYVSAMEHPYFAVVGEDGKFEIPNLPPGDYVIEAWHEKLGVQEHKLHLEPTQTTEVTFTFRGA